MGREAEREAFGAVEPRAGQREKDADASFEPRQIPAAADVGEQADPGLGHREAGVFGRDRSEEHTSELQSLMRISYAVFCLKKKKKNNNYATTNDKIYHEYS